MAAPESESTVPSVPQEEAVAPFVLAIDVGTSSVRALVFDRHARDVPGTECQLAYEIVTTPDGGVEVDAEALLDLTLQCIDGVVARSGPLAQHIRAVGIASFWHSLVGLDRAGRPLTPVLFYSDTRSAPDVDELRSELDGDAVHARVGTVLHSSYWPGKLRWIRRTRPEVWESVDRWCAFTDFLERELFGADGTSVSMASGTGMLDVRQIAWDSDLIEATGVESSTLAPIRSQATPLTGLRPDFARRWTALADIPWFYGIGDGACANVGCGATFPGRVALTVGTTGAMRVVVPSPAGQPVEIPTDLWCYRLDEQHAVLGAAISNGGKLLAWFADLLGADLSGDELAAAGALPPCRHGLTVLPFLAGERSPIWNDHATGVVAGLTLATDKTDLLRAAMESVALRFARLHPALARVADPNHEVVTNGAAILRSRAWMHMHADALQRPLRALPPAEESTARGAAVMALINAGIARDFPDLADPVDSAETILPQPEHAAVYAEAVERQRQLENLLFPNRTAWDQSLGA